VAQVSSEMLYNVMAGSESDFEVFVSQVELRLRRALVSAYGPQVGREATVDALAFAWEHWEKLEGMANPVGYLYRVGQTSARGQLRPTPFPDGPSQAAEPQFEPALRPALDALSEQQRIVVVLVHGYGWPQREVAELLDLSASTIRNHLDRALTRLRDALEVDHVR
jgi:DNA-directed RNA polymerase specialized sigma24 family protein